MAAGYVKATAPGGRLAGGRYRFPIVSVGATENVVMAAVTGEGHVSVIENAAREPEIVDLCRCLVAMGAQIDGIGTETLEIEGVDRLHGATYCGDARPDRGGQLCLRRGDHRRRAGAGRASSRTTCARRSPRWSRRA